jgi:FAD/FMN-containing dehydrogenase
VGTIGDSIDEFTLLLPSGEARRCSRDENAGLFRAAIGGLGMLGVFLDVTLRLKKISSGLLRVQRHAVSSLDEMLKSIENRSHDADYLVGWLDAFARGPALGRGLVETANYVEDDADAATTLRAAYQDLPDTVLGIVPRSRLWLAMRTMANDRGMRALNIAQYASGSLRGGRVTHVPHAHFHFYLDYVPNFKRAFQPTGIVQYQIFVPQGAAREVCRTVLVRSQDEGLFPYLAVLKLHREDDFLLRYDVDGYSLALDYRATPRNQDRLRSFLERLTEELVLPAGGRFYPAKDSLLHPQHARTMFGEATIKEYLDLKRRVDPEGLLQSDLFRRLFARGGEGKD